jgi:sigma-E factor negative regulatory protein RseB
VAPDGGNGLRHIVYSDGLATVSLFIEPAVAASEQAEGLSQIGAANAYTAIVGGHMVTAVGEVPARTVELLARSARPAAAVEQR